MRYFYEMYPDIEIRQQTADALAIPEDRHSLWMVLIRQRIVPSLWTI